MDRQEYIGEPSEVISSAIESRVATIWTALPGIVTEVFFETQTLTVQPTIKGVIRDRDGNLSNVDMPLLLDVIIMWPRAGGFAITLPVSAGDEVLVIFASRCIDSWWQSGEISVPVEFRMHDLSDGFALLAPTSQPKKLDSVQTDGVELRNESRSTYIKLTDGTIYIKGNVVHEGNTDQTGNVNHNGSLDVTGGVVTAGAGLDVTGNVTANSINIGSTHTHTGVTSGTSNTGPPV